MGVSNLKVLSRGRCPKSPDLSVSIVFPDWWYSLMTIMQEQRNNLAMRVTLVPVANMLKALLRSF